MQVTETLNEGLKRGYEITVTADELDQKVTDKLVEAQPEVEMKGFRKGKVPLPLLKKQFGERVLGEAMQEAVDGAMSQHFEDTGDKPAAQPAVEMVDGENWKEGQDVKVKMTYERLPDVPDVDFGQIKLERMVVTPTEADVTEALENLAESAQNFEDREAGAAAQDGDQVVFDFVGKIDGEAFEGGASEDFALVLGSGQFIPGFEEQIVGVTAGEEKTVEVTFPEDYGAEHLAGKAATFDCTIKAVKAPAKAEINDELATQYGAEDLDSLKSQIRERLESEFGSAARAVAKRALLDELDKAVDFELPEGLLETEAKQIAHQLWHEENPEVEGHDHPEIEPTEEHTALARRRVKLGLYLAEVGQAEEVQVSDSEFTQAVMEQARQYPGQERQFFEFVQQNQQMQQQIRAPLFEDKVVDLILEKADVTEKEVTKDDLQKAVEALEDE
ncbi:MAG: trigger factor [Salibaculum sp.]|uniref:trigger factor n=1 Tax=Salibaculum sp. TaxID=2855480 RepID=UPI0028705C7C|nr:trigger factor [Salibaculum sp.]MDR9428149.1 trigger factor [Salibaculum sp.]MDR9481845.1 trigger factor [Salibaculum sp.]